MLLLTIVNVLRQRTTPCTLYRFDDWHEHDGYVTESVPVDWESLDQILLRDQNLHDSRHGDASVRWAYYPDDCSFLLRYDVLDPREEPDLSEPVGECDLCADEATIREVCSSCGQWIDSLEVVRAKEYFDRAYAG